MFATADCGKQIFGPGPEACSELFLPLTWFMSDALNLFDLEQLAKARLPQSAFGC